MRKLWFPICWCLTLILAACGGSENPQIQNRQAKMSIVSPAPPSGSVGVAYGGMQGFSFVAAGGVAPYTWSWSATDNQLPPGLTLSQETGEIAGTPLTSGTYSFQIKVRDSNSPANEAAASYTLIIADPISISINSSAPPEAFVGSAYAQPAGFAFTATGGVEPYTWSWTANDGLLPLGLDLSANGVISGTPTAEGAYHVHVTVVDSAVPSNENEQNYTILIFSSPDQVLVTSSAPPSGKVGSSYGGYQVIGPLRFTGFPLTAAGGDSSYTWQAYGLPPGLAIKVFESGGGSTRCCVSAVAIYGIPKTAGQYSVKLVVSDAASPPNQASQSYTVNIQP